MMRFFGVDKNNSIIFAPNIFYNLNFKEQHEKSYVSCIMQHGIGIGIYLLPK